MSKDILYYDRSDQTVKKEKVYGEAGIKLLYLNPIGKMVRYLFTRPFFSDLYGWFQDHPLSSRKVTDFVEKFQIPLNQYEAGSLKHKDQTHSYKSFNEFFIREFKSGQRPFESTPEIMPAFCEARYYGWAEIKDNLSFPVKGTYLNAPALLGSLNSRWGDTFKDGPLLLARLCPVDYHRFHYPDNGRLIEVSDEGHELESVNPLALSIKPKIFLKNKRRVSIIETVNFGKIAYIEVGATCVGKIIQSNRYKNFKRGDEKGYFLFGGSTVIVVGEPGKWKPSQDILEKTSNQQEVLVQLGQAIGQKS